MELFSNIKQKIKNRKFIVGVCLFLITFLLCTILFRYWETLKDLVLGG
jgi:hypothetical protein